MGKYKLSDLNPGETAIVSELSNTGSMRRRLLDMGLIENTFVECVGKSPGGALKAFMIRGAVVALRDEDSKNISVTKNRRC
ncbi:MAG: FeoA family protein [Clostridia bacterium]|nr:FeoA family protein [Clostridia bacterium]